jgi:hypothetical protein
MLELKPSKYLPFFMENVESLNKELELVGDILLVERISREESRVAVYCRFQTDYEYWIDVRDT